MAPSSSSSNVASSIVTTAASLRRLRQKSEAEKRLVELLVDETTHQVLSTFELNRLASFSYNDETCDEMFEIMTEIMADPLCFSILCVQKSCVVTQHILVYGSEKSVSSCFGMKFHIEALCQYNTVLWAHEQRQRRQKNRAGRGGWGSLWQTVKGGSVDHGHPVREAAQRLHNILAAGQDHVRELRRSKADPNSLVPVGHDDRAGFVSDDVRLFMLEKRLRQQQLLETKSNLAATSARGAFGSGFSGKNGTTVVGAAHSMEEMLAHAARKEKKFSDSGPIHYKSSDFDYNNNNKDMPPKKAKVKKAQSAPVDLLDFSEPPQQQQQQSTAPDLLDFSKVPEAEATTIQPTADFFNVAQLQPTLEKDQKQSDEAAAPNLLDPFPDQQSQPLTTSGGLLDLMPATTAPVADPFQGMTATIPTTTTSIGSTTTPDLMGLSSPPPATADLMGISSPPPASSTLDTTADLMGISSPPVNNNSGVMSSSLQEDRFSALDALASTTTTTTSQNSILNGMAAESRILSGGSMPKEEEEPPSLGHAFAGLSMNTTTTPVTMAPLTMTDEAEGFAVMGGGDNIDTHLNDFGTPMGGEPATTPSVPLNNGIANNNVDTAPTVDTGMGAAAPTMSELHQPPQEEPVHVPTIEIPKVQNTMDVVAGGSLQSMGITAQYGCAAFDVNHDDDDDDCGFVMGGAAGDGLDPTAPMPAVPPPPPPFAAMY